MSSSDEFPVDVLDKYWLEYCSGLQGLTYTSDVVHQLWHHFAVVLEEAVLSTISGSRGSSATVFHVPLTHFSLAVCPEAVATIIDTPHIAIPLLEFFRALLEHKRAAGAAANRRADEPQADGGGAARGR